MPPQESLFLRHNCELPGPRKASCPPSDRLGYSRTRRNLKALPTTLTEDSAIAAAAMIGESKIPKIG